MLQEGFGDMSKLLFMYKPWMDDSVGFVTFNVSPPRGVSRLDHLSLVFRNVVFSEVCYFNGRSLPESVHLYAGTYLCSLFCNIPDFEWSPGRYGEGTIGRLGPIILHCDRYGDPNTGYLEGVGFSVISSGGNLD